MDDKDVNRLVEETLNSIDNIKRINAKRVDLDDILFKTNNRRFERIEYSIQFIYKAAAIFFLLFTLNIFTLIQIKNMQERYTKFYYNNSINSSVESYFK